MWLVRRIQIMTNGYEQKNVQKSLINLARKPKQKWAKRYGC